MLESTTTLPAAAISSPWIQSKRTHETRNVASGSAYTNPIRCCNAFAHTSTSPSSLDSRCSAIGPEPEAPDNGQAIDAGQAAASIHRMHHSNERPVGVAKIGHAEEPISAACTALAVHYLLPSTTIGRVLAS